MSGRSKETHAVQVFPFLAVLVCTMGSLIFLLLVTTQQIRHRAIALAAYEQAQQELAAAESAPLPVLSIPIPEPELETDTPTIVIPVQPEPEPKSITPPDHSYEIALAER